MKPMKALEPITKGSEEASTWWPRDLGSPSVTGSSNAVRYAYFASKHRLAVDDGKAVKVYDTTGKTIRGFSSSRDTLTFDTGDGPMKLSSLKPV